jgi:hypothetical protein
MMSKEAGAYADLQREVMASLRATHPNWTEDIFDIYEARFAEHMRALLGRRKHRHLRSTGQMA